MNPQTKKLFDLVVDHLEGGLLRKVAREIPELSGEVDKILQKRCLGTRFDPEKKLRPIFHNS